LSRHIRYLTLHKDDEADRLAAELSRVVPKVVAMVQLIPNEEALNIKLVVVIMMMLLMMIDSDESSRELFSKMSQDTYVSLVPGLETTIVKKKERC
jgi:hypothetical protein